jgi:hypothetical protein
MTVVEGKQRKVDAQKIDEIMSRVVDILGEVNPSMSAAVVSLSKLLSFAISTAPPESRPTILAGAVHVITKNAGVKGAPDGGPTH